MTYNGHKNWNHWNVSLWITNDEALFNTARSCVRYARGSKDDAAALMLDTLHEMGMHKTPDGAPFSKTTILAAMRGM